MKHTMVALVEDRPGVLNRVASLFRRRGFNIDSLAVGTTEEAGISRMTIVVEDEGAGGIVDQVQRQLYKLIDVVRVEQLTSAEAVMRELALVKVRCTTEQRHALLDLVGIFRAHVVDVSPTTVVVEESWRRRSGCPRSSRTSSRTACSNSCVRDASRCCAGSARRRSILPSGRRSPTRCNGSTTSPAGAPRATCRT